MTVKARPCSEPRLPEQDIVLGFESHTDKVYFTVFLDIEEARTAIEELQTALAKLDEEKP